MIKETCDDTANSEWQLGPGPVGGTVLTRRAGDDWEIIVPPGRGAEHPERLVEMTHWRFAVLSGGQLVTKVTLGLDEVMGLAPDQQDWMFGGEVEELTRDIMHRPWPTETEL